MTRGEEVGDLLLHALALAGSLFGLRGRRPPPLRGQLARGQGFAHCHPRPQDRLDQFFENVEFADLVGNVAEDLAQRLWIQGRRVRGDAPQLQAAQLQGHPEAVEERRNVLVIGIMIENLLKQSLERAVVDNGQDAKRTVVQFVGREVSRKVSQAPVEIGRPHLPGRFFSPRPPPSSEWISRGRPDTKSPTSCKIRVATPCRKHDLPQCGHGRFL